MKICNVFGKNMKIHPNMCPKTSIDGFEDARACYNINISTTNLYFW